MKRLLLPLLAALALPNAVHADEKVSALTAVGKARAANSGSSKGFI